MPGHNVCLHASTHASLNCLDTETQHNIPKNNKSNVPLFYLKLPKNKRTTTAKEATGEGEAPQMNPPPADDPA